MDEIIKKVAAYDLMNALIPGAVLVFFLKVFNYLELEDCDAFFLGVLSYLLGLVASRVGSLIIEPIAKKVGWIQHDYEHYVKAEKHDNKIIRLTTVPNMYRTLTGSVVVLAIIALGSLVPAGCRFLLYVFYGITCFIIFLSGWIKQEYYVLQRVNLYRKGTNDGR